MKLLSNGIAATIVLSLLSCTSVNGENPQECVTEFDETKDYFPDKAVVDFAETYSVEYGNSYKIVTNTDAGKSYLLYQCGTPIPSNLNQSSYDAILSIPLTNFGLEYSTFVPFTELLELRSLQTAQAGFDDYFFSPCFNDLIDTGGVALISDVKDDALVTAAGVSKDVPFFMGVGSSSVFDTNIEISEWKDTSNLAVFEWIKFFSVFFNRESIANEVFGASKARYECATDNAQILTADKPKPKVVWASYSTWNGGGFYPAGTCPNYYCELATACGAELLLKNGPLNLTEFVDFAKDADVWLYSGTNFETVLNDFEDELSVMKSVQNNELFDIMGHGEDAWYNERKVEPDAILEDFCHMVGTENVNSPHIPAFFRHIDNPEMSPGQCNDQSSSYLNLGSYCEPIGMIEPETPVYCFSGVSTVNLEDGTTLALKNLKIGDRVQVTNDGKFDEVYSFGHYEPDSVGAYLSIHSAASATPILISALHMLFLDNAKAVPASSVNVGDILLGGHTITKIKNVNAKGAFAPFTYSGTVVVDNIVASNYVSLTGRSTFLGMDMQFVAHTVVAARRLLCRLNTCDEQYNKEGIATWIPFEIFSLIASHESSISLFAVVVGAAIMFLRRTKALNKM